MTRSTAISETVALHINDEDAKRQNIRIKSHQVSTPVMKPKRKRITPEQFRVLSDLFEKTDTPNYELRETTAKQLDMTNREVQVWFQNRRAKANKLRLQEQQQRQASQQQQQQQQVQPHQRQEVSSHERAFQEQAPIKHSKRRREPVFVYPQWVPTCYPSYPSRDTDKHRYFSQSPPSPPPADEPSPCDSASSTSSSSVITTPISYPSMSPIDILAMAAEYVRCCDEEQQQQTKRQRKIDEDLDKKPTSWRPWL
ncbi:homeobox domain-containing protein [Radiomyces spectabilis]|uniref:homeobox domain-containing protein n=1 Tax=Radiomyces spectabilis TaxID=64574 RepID=UPI0022203948|nr:homeobox domain-containing protein [Radiomyces spectabilis]KAI8384916.1 homeobox domain-containing protein [Radiomyces spectabilis]